MQPIKGLIIHHGKALAKAYIVSNNNEYNNIKNALINQKKVLEEALRLSTNKLQQQITNDLNQYSDTVKMIFEAHKLMVNDPLLLEAAYALIDGGASAYEAYRQATKNIIEQFRFLQSDYMRNRIVDIEDATDRVLSTIIDTEYAHEFQFEEPRIVVMDKTKPSLVVNCHKPYVVGIVGKEGAYNQHSSMIAREFDLPGLIVGVAANQIRNGDLLLLDAEHGTLYINPTAELIAAVDPLGGAR